MTVERVTTGAAVIVHLQFLETISKLADTVTPANAGVQRSS